MNHYTVSEYQWSHLIMLCCILDFERGRKKRQDSEFSREEDFIRWFPVAFLANVAVIVTGVGSELTTIRKNSLLSTKSSMLQF